MGWIRTIKSLYNSARQTLSRVPSTLKKKVIRSNPVRSVLVGQLGRIFTSVVEMHILSIACIGLKWAVYSGALYMVGDPQCEDPGSNYFHTSLILCDWAVDILIPVVFALQCHTSFVSLITWTFERPLYSLARRIQYMRPNDIYQFLRIKYTILVPVLLYVGLIVFVSPLNQEFILICLVQTLIIQSLTDFWPLRQDWMVLPECLNPSAPARIRLLVDSSKHTKSKKESDNSSDIARYAPDHFSFEYKDPFSSMTSDLTPSDPNHFYSEYKDPFASMVFE